MLCSRHVSYIQPDILYTRPHYFIRQFAVSAILRGNDWLFSLLAIKHYVLARLRKFLGLGSYQRCVADDPSLIRI
jgi:hypothetical protein